LSPKKWGYVEEDDYEEGESDYNFAHWDYDFEDDDGMLSEFVDDKVVDDLLVQHMPTQCYPREVKMMC
jgi:hypothetical protein